MADPVAAYNDLVAATPDAAAQAAWLNDTFRARNVTFGGEPMRSFLRPHFVARQDWTVLRDTGCALLELAARAARRAFDGEVNPQMAFLGTPEAEARWVAIDPGAPDVLLSRLDAFLTPDGPRYIEVNSDAPAGFGYGDRMAEVFAELPVFREFAERQAVSYVASGPRLVEAVLELARQRGAGPTVAIVDWADVKTRPDQEILAAAFAARGATCVLVDPRAMEIAGGRLVADGRPVDVVYRRGVLTELVQREDDVRAFLEAYRQGLALFVNSFRCHLSEDKAFFAILTDEAFASLLEPSERELVARVVPWTRRLEERRTLRGGSDVDLVAHVVAAREQLVLKPAHGYGGQSVYVGDQTEPAAWETAVHEALRDSGTWVVQERVPIPQERFPVLVDGQIAFEDLNVNANPFYVAGAEVGAVTRASRSAVINVSAGGGSAPTFVVDGATA